MAAKRRRKSGPEPTVPFNAFGLIVNREREIASASGRFTGTWDDLAESAGTRYRTLYGYMRGPDTKKIPASIVAGLADALGVSTDRLRVAPALHVVREDAEGYPAIEAYIAAHPDIEPNHATELRALRRSGGPDQITYAVAEGYHRGAIARDKMRPRPELTE